MIQRSREIRGLGNLGFMGSRVPRLSRDFKATGAQIISRGTGVRAFRDPVAQGVHGSLGIHGVWVQVSRGPWAVRILLGLGSLGSLGGQRSQAVSGSRGLGVYGILRFKG